MFKKLNFHVAGGHYSVYDLSTNVFSPFLIRQILETLSITFLCLPKHPFSSYTAVLFLTFGVAFKFSVFPSACTQIQPQWNLKS